MKKESDFLKNTEGNQESREDKNKEGKKSGKKISTSVSFEDYPERIDTDIQSATTRIQEVSEKIKTVREKSGLPSRNEELSSTKIEQAHIKKLEAQKSKLEQEKQKEKQEITLGFAQELRDTPKGKFYQKLKKLAGAFVLAGLSIFEPGQAIAPELTKQTKILMEVERQYELTLSKEGIGKSGLFKFPLDPQKGMEKIQKFDSRLYQGILKQFREKGGVALSPQLPETVYRQDRFSEIAQTESLEVDPPFYNRPEVILGKEFIAKNPEKAKEYLEKISKAMRAIVRLEREAESGLGSGVLIKGKRDQVFVLTNDHVVGDNIFLKIACINKDRTLTKTKVKVLVRDEENDIALLVFTQDKKNLGWTKELTTLPIEEKPSIKDKGKIATIGHAIGFPYTVGIAEAIKIPGSNALLSRRDKRFSALELYSEFSPDQKKINPFFKGDVIPGMSGGSVINLEQPGDPKLAGLIEMTIDMHMIEQHHQNQGYEKISFRETKIHDFYGQLKKAGYGKENRVGKMVTSEVILRFLKKHNLYE